MGGRRKMLLASGLALLALALLSAPTSAECPNGCSGNGACMNKDMCQCYKNYQGNDCMDRTCQFGYAHADTPKGDINYDQSRATMGWILPNSQQAPASTYEYFNPDAANDEAHFYMECSNKGLCDRSLGVCTCFDGYEGVACQRASCPNKCSGHGTCESIRELGLTTQGTLFGIPSFGDTISYDLWDSRVTYGCRCDPWYHGADCSLRSCKVGVDPMFVSTGTPVYETFAVHVYTATADFVDDSAALLNYFRLRMFDYHGESYITDPIQILDDSVAGNPDKNANAVAAAIKKIPNMTFKDITCDLSTSADGLDGYKTSRAATTKGLSVICQFTENPGRLRAPEVATYAFTPATPSSAAVKVYTLENGMDNEWFTVAGDTYTGTTANPIVLENTNYLEITANGITTANGLAAVDVALTLLKIGSHVVAGAYTAATKKLLMKYPFRHTLSTTSIQRFDIPTGSNFAMISLTIVLGVAVGDTKITVTTDPAFTAGAGQLIFYQNQFYKYTKVVASGANFDIYLDRPFAGNSYDGKDSTTAYATTITKTLNPLVAYKITPPDKAYQYNYVSQCSGRGLCTTETGICACFKGYTNDNCNTQNILAL